MNQINVGRVVDRVALAKAQISSLEADIAGDIALLKKLGGGESESWRAEVVKMPARTMTIKAHRQLRFYAA